MVIGTILAFIGIATLIFGIILINRSVQVDTKTREINSALAKEKEVLEKEIELYKQRKREQEEESEVSFERYCDILEISYLAKDNEYDAKLNNLYATYQREVEKLDREYSIHKQQMQDALQCYCDVLDNDYKDKEAEYENRYRCLKESYDNLQDMCMKDLEKIQSTRAAALEAQLREEEIQLKSDFYKLHLTETEEITIKMIEDLMPRIPEPRVLSMLIWQTFYQKQMTALCNNVLGTEKVCGIYKITNQESGACYIGQATDMAARWKEHAKCGLGIDTPSQNKLYKAIQHYGLVNFTFELLEECPRGQLNEKEKFYIGLYQSYEYGYNSTSGNK